MLSVFQVWVDLEFSQRLDSDAFADRTIPAKPVNGESVAGRNWPQNLRVFDADIPRSNFFALNDSFLTMDANAAAACRDGLKKTGEFVPLRMGEGEQVWLFNPWLTIEQAGVDWAKTRYSFGVYYNLTLKAEYLSGARLFRIPKISGLFLSTTLETDETDFFYLYQKHGLMGLYFKKLWDENNGGVPDRSTGPRVDD